MAVFTEKINRIAKIANTDYTLSTMEVGIIKYFFLYLIKMILLGIGMGRAMFNSLTDPLLYRVLTENSQNLLHKHNYTSPCFSGVNHKKFCIRTGLCLNTGKDL